MMEASGGGGRRRRFPADGKVDSPNLRDFLRVKQDGQSNSSSPSVTLGAVLSQNRLPPPTDAAALVHRTLLDIIRDDPSGASRHHGDRMTWWNFKDKLRVRRAGVAWTSSVPIPASDVPMTSGRRSTDLNMYSSQPSSAAGEDIIRSELTSTSSLRAMMTRHNSRQMPPPLTSTYGRVSEEADEEEERESEDSEDGGEPQARMSLMALLAETDRQMGLGESPFVMDDDNVDDDEDDEEEGVRLGVEGYNCCVCMVRHKGAALIPCGHTFCRLCSRELWVQRGNCPLCNNFILEILDIF